MSETATADLPISVDMPGSVAVPEQVQVRDGPEAGKMPMMRWGTEMVAPANPVQLWVPAQLQGRRVRVTVENLDAPTPSSDGPVDRDLDSNPYSSDERRVAEWLANRTGIGAGADPIGFLMSAHEFLSERVNELRQVRADAVPTTDRSCDGYAPAKTPSGGI